MARRTYTAGMAEDDPRERAAQRTLLMPRRELGCELRAGHKLQEFIVERLLGVGGYSCVYLARDTRLDRRVALKMIWRDDTYFNARSMDVYIAKLRKYLRSDPAVEIINVHGTGFRLMG
mgnify:CR=1 FL=1